MELVLNITLYGTFFHLIPSTFNPFYVHFYQFQVGNFLNRKPLGHYTFVYSGFSFHQVASRVRPPVISRICSYQVCARAWIGPRGLFHTFFTKGSDRGFSALNWEALPLLVSPLVGPPFSLRVRVSSRVLSLGLVPELGSRGRPFYPPAPSARIDEHSPLERAPLFSPSFVSIGVIYAFPT